MTRHKIIAASSIFAAVALSPGPARAMHIASSTDEARALAALELPKVVEVPAPIGASAVIFSDDARRVAGAMRPGPVARSQERTHGPIGTTDEARAAVEASRG